MRVAEVAEPAGVLERIKTQIGLQNVHSAPRLTRKDQAEAEAGIGKIGIERHGQLILHNRRFMLPLKQQHPSKLGVRFG
jgi:hypothetical protein